MRSWLAALDSVYSPCSILPASKARVAMDVGVALLMAVGGAPETTLTTHSRQICVSRSREVHETAWEGACGMLYSGKQVDIITNELTMS